MKRGNFFGKFKKFEKFLPSRKFAVIAGLGIGLIGCIVLLFSLFGGKENFAREGSNLALKDKTVIDLVQQDTDKDSIPDWEEALWGTDKNSKVTFDGMPDTTYIENKKKSLKLEAEAEVSENTSSETDKFAREFFSAYAALKSEGVDSLTINNFSSALGQKIVDPLLIDKYIERNVREDPIDTEESRATYYLAIKEIFDRHKESGIGNELDIANTGLIAYDSSETANIDELVLIADAYAMFSAEMMEVAVPESLAIYHLQIANSANNISISVSNLTKIIDDPIVGLAGLSQYQKYSEELITAVADLENAM